MTLQRPAILDCAATLADVTRCRLLQLLEKSELTVSELCTVVQLPQSTVSRHLKVLADGGWVRSRRDGTSHLYQLAIDALPPAIQSLWHLIREEMATATATAQDFHRLDGVLAQRRSRSQEFFASTAGEWDRLRDELFGTSFDLHALLGLADRGWTVGDLACGTGRVAAALAPFVRQVIAVDDSPAMLEAARARLEPCANVSVLEGTLEKLPIDGERLDVAALFLALHHLADPARALAEARRTLKPGGQILVVDMTTHDREDYRQQMGHVWLGFGREQICRWLEAAGLEELHFHSLPSPPEARGPALFVAVGRRPARVRGRTNDAEAPGRAVATVAV